MSRSNAMLRGASGGLGRLASALGGGNAAEQQGYDQGMARETKMSQVLAQIAAQRANADFDTARADGERVKNEALAQRPRIIDDLIAGSSGTDLPTVNAYRQKLRTGELVTDFQPETESKLVQALTRFAPLATNTSDIKADDWQKALSGFGEDDLRAQVLSGQRDPKTVALAQRAIKGEAAYQPAEYGVTDLFTGKVDATGAPAMRFGQYRDSTTAAQKANAAQSYASANASNASAARTRAEMADGVNRSGGKAPTGYRWGADGQTLEAIPGGPADPNTKGAKLQRPPTEGQAKAIGFGSRMAVADEILGELAEEGAMRPGAIKGTAETVGNVLGLGTDSMGGALSDIAGTMTNWTQSEAQQQVEQAQRDFVNAILRRESGAAIGLGEFRNAAKQYFPQPGDDKKTLAQKAANRRVAINAMKAEFGEAYLPDFTRSVEEARAARRATQKPKQGGGADGGWDGDGWKIERVN